MLKSVLKNKYSKWIFLLLFILGVCISDYLMHDYYNIHGYRGKIAEEKKVGEYRIACFGGSTTYGFGVEEQEAWPAQLGKLLGEKYSVVNLGANNQGIYGIANDIHYYEDLDFEMAILYQGETDRDPTQLRDYNFRGGDPFFFCFGYKPILNFYIKELIRKATPLDKNAEKPVFKGNNTDTELRAQVNQYYRDADMISQAMMNKGEHPYKDYINKLDKVLQNLSSKNIRTVVVCQPNAFNSFQQYCIRQLIDSKYLNKVEYLNLNDLFDDLNAASFDGMHLKKEGYLQVAERIKLSLFK